MPLDNSDIRWVLDLVVALEEVINSINVRLEKLQRVYKEDREHITNILQANSDMIDDIGKDLSNIIKKITEIKSYHKSSSPPSQSIKRNGIEL